MNGITNRLRFLRIDRLVVIGNHRDAWVYGGADPSSGTASMLETARVIGSLTNIGMLHFKQFTSKSYYLCIELYLLLFH